MYMYCTENIDVTGQNMTSYGSYYVLRTYTPLEVCITVVEHIIFVQCFICNTVWEGQHIKVCSYLLRSCTILITHIYTHTCMYTLYHTYVHASLVCLLSQLYVPMRSKSL